MQTTEHRQSTTVRDVTDSMRPIDPWSHRHNGMICATCMWNTPKETPENRITPVNGPLGRCRRHAPTMSGFPAVFATDWCGDHKLDENKI